MNSPSNLKVAGTETRASLLGAEGAICTWAVQFTEFFFLRELLSQGE